MKLRVKSLKLSKDATDDVKQQMLDNIKWIEAAKENNMVAGSKARILYANSEGRIEIAKAFNKAIVNKTIGPIILGRDHHDVSGLIHHSEKPLTFMTDLSLQLIWNS